MLFTPENAYKFDKDYYYLYRITNRVKVTFSICFKKLIKNKMTVCLNAVFVSGEADFN